MKAAQVKLGVKPDGVVTPKLVAQIGNLPKAPAKPAAKTSSKPTARAKFKAAAPHAPAASAPKPSAPSAPAQTPSGQRGRVKFQ